LPEAYLGTPKEAAHQKAINATMHEYLDQGILYPVNGFIYTERFVENHLRRGLIAALDLEQYSFQKGSQSLIRATEGTIIERLPPRIRIRKSALLELPHIMVLIDDPEKTVIEPLAAQTSAMDALYDFDLMQNGGHLKGFLVKNAEMEKSIVAALEKLSQPEILSRRYKLTKGETPFLYAVGDGNHSLATAKSIWEEMKATAGEDHPARYALVELVNIHDEGINFEPIHRLLKNVSADLISKMKHYWNDEISIENQKDFSQIKKNVLSQSDDCQRFGYFSSEGFQLISLENPRHSLTVGSVQNFLDQMHLSHNIGEIDYVHGDDAILKLGTAANNAGIYLPVLSKSQLFEAVIKDGELPRKTFPWARRTKNVSTWNVVKFKHNFYDAQILFLGNFYPSIDSLYEFTPQ
jgi:uncharacterized protein (DUF1015 family)